MSSSSQINQNDKLLLTREGELSGHLQKTHRSYLGWLKLAAFTILLSKYQRENVGNIIY
jgi:hypothetical protein